MLVLGIVLRVHHLSWGLPTYWVPDERNLIDQGVEIAACDILAGGRCPHPRATGFLGFGRFAYPHLQHYLLNFASHLAGLPVRQPGSDMAQRVLLGRVVTVLFSVAAIVLTFLIGWRLFSARAGLLAALLLAVTPYHVVYSHLVNVDIPLLSWVLLSFYFALLAAEQRRVAYLFFAAACAGLAGATKYPGVLVLLPVLAALLIGELRAWRAGEASSSPRVIGLVLLACLVCGAAFALGCPLCILEWDRWLKEVRSLQGFHRDWGVGVVLAPVGWIYRPYVYQGLAALPFSLGWPLYVWSLLGLGALLVRRDRRVIVPLSFVLPYPVYFARSRTVFTRYYLPLLPFLVIFAAGLVETDAWRSGRYRRVFSLLVVATTAYTGVLAFSLANQFSFADREEVVTWLNERVEQRRNEAKEGGEPREPHVALPLGPTAHYDGLVRAARGASGLRFVDFRPTEAFISETRPDYIVLSVPYEVGVLRSRPRSADASVLRDLSAGKLGYDLVKVVETHYFTERLYTSLDPAFKAIWTHGEIGFRIYARRSTDDGRSRNHRADAHNAATD